MTTTQPGPAVGYTIMRTGQGASFEACIVCPHVDMPSSLAFDESARRLDVQCGAAAISLPDIPGDVAKLLTSDPGRILFVTTDTLSAVRSSARADALSQRKAH